MSEVIVLQRAGVALRVRVERRPGPRVVRLVLRLDAAGLGAVAIAARLRLRRAYVRRLCAMPARPAIRAVQASWTGMVARATAAVEREMAA